MNLLSLTSQGQKSTKISRKCQKYEYVFYFLTKINLFGIKNETNTKTEIIKLNLTKYYTIPSFFYLNISIDILNDLITKMF